MKHAWEDEKHVQIVVGRPRGEELFEKHRRTGPWQDNIKMILKEIGCEGMGRILLDQDMDLCRALSNKVITLDFCKR
jgi:hypothetical protein